MGIAGKLRALFGVRRKNQASSYQIQDIWTHTKIIVQVQKFWLGKIPATLAEKMLSDAMERYDNQQGTSSSIGEKPCICLFLLLGIQQLLIIFLCLIENIRSATISTPLYLYQWKQGRIQLNLWNDVVQRNKNFKSSDCWRDFWREIVLRVAEISHLTCTTSIIGQLFDQL